jgi:hypothetical protein
MTTKTNLTQSILKVTAVIALSALLSGCGQNPHVLGQDPSIAGGMRGPEAPEGGEEQGKGEEKKECVRPTVSFFPSRDVESSDRKRIDLATRSFFATDISLPPRSVITDLSLVKLSIDTPGSSSRKSSAGDEICLQEENFCADAGNQDLSGINLFGVFKSADWNEILFSHSTLTWSVPSEWGMNDALLSVAYMRDYCVGKEPKP